MIGQIFRQGWGIIQALWHERLPAERVRAMQNRKLRAMVTHAWDNSPFYRAKMEAAGLTPADLRTIEDLPKLPVTTKLEVLEAGLEQVMARGYTPDNTEWEATSGSSGKVLHLYHSRQAFDTYFAFAFRHLTQIGYRPWHRVAYTASEPLPRLPWERFGLGRRQQVDLRATDPRSYLADLLAINPQIITAYPSILLLIIRVATPEELARIRPIAIHLHSELLHDGIRDEIRMAFDCDVYEDYSTIECHQVSYECPRHRNHIAADNVIAEVVIDGRPASSGERGDIVLTNLNNKAMPLLRYAIGDIGLAGAGSCACGSGFPTMDLVEGRVDDYVILPSGRRISPRSVNPVFEHLPGIREHVLVQEQVDHIVVNLHLDPGHIETTPPLVIKNLRELLAEPVTIDINLTTEFERGRTGKLRCIVSKVKPPAHAIERRYTREQGEYAEV